MTDPKAALSVVEQRETFVRPDGSTYTRDDIFVKLAVTFRDEMLAVLKGPKLSVYLCLALHCGETMTSWPSLATICAKTGYSNRAVITALDALDDMGLIEKRRRQKTNGGNDSTMYKVKGFCSMGKNAPYESSSQGVVNNVHHPNEPGSHKEEPCKKGPTEERERAIQADTSSLSPIVLPSGDYQGKTLQQILDLDPGYLRWVSRNWGTESVRQAAAELLAQADDAKLDAARTEALAEEPIDPGEYLDY